MIAAPQPRHTVAEDDNRRRHLTAVTTRDTSKVTRSLQLPQMKDLQTPHDLANTNEHRLGGSLAASVGNMDIQNGPFHPSHSIPSRKVGVRSSKRAKVLAIAALSSLSGK